MFISLNFARVTYWQTHLFSAGFHPLGDDFYEGAFARAHVLDGGSERSP
jgi:hypothetical protein